jgi:ABC-2 type transport system permease protein
MKIHLFRAVIWKELREVNRVAILASLAFALFWAIIGVISHWRAEGITFPFAGYFPLALMLYIGNSLIMRVFAREKVLRTIEPLLCTPLNVRDIWWGKVLSVLIIAYLILLVTACVYFICIIPRDGRVQLFNVLTIFQLLVTSPLLALAVFGLMGYVYLVILNPAIVHYINLVSTMAILYAVFRASNRLVVTWASNFAMLSLAAVLLIIAFRLVSHLDKERIVLTIP